MQKRFHQLYALFFTIHEKRLMRLLNRKAQNTIFSKAFTCNLRTPVFQIIVPPLALCQNFAGT